MKPQFELSPGISSPKAEEYEDQEAVGIAPTTAKGQSERSGQILSAVMDQGDVTAC